MPPYQLKYVLELELGLKWRERFVEFDEHPFAAASIGQCHRAVINTGKDNDNNTRQVVVKVQYPGVSQSIASDLKNLQKVLTYTDIIPSGMFLDKILYVAQEELGKECHYTLEHQNQEKFKELFRKDEILINNKFYIPNVIPYLSTDRLITTDYCPGLPIDQARKYVNQHECNRLGTMILYLTLKELVLWRFMQTDPNWSNYLYDINTNSTYCIDFGSCREYSLEFVRSYFSLIKASVHRDEAKLLSISHEMGFLSGKENPVLLRAHVKSGFILGEPFQENVYDFGKSNINVRIGKELYVFLQHRVKDPPEEVYTLHRKLAGCYLLCRKMGAKVKCGEVLQRIVYEHSKEINKF
jgi:aarF domain-containing kinase